MIDRSGTLDILQVRLSGIEVSKDLPVDLSHTGAGIFLVLDLRGSLDRHSRRALCRRRDIRLGVEVDEREIIRGT